MFGDVCSPKTVVEQLGGEDCCGGRFKDYGVVCSECCCYIFCGDREWKIPGGDHDDCVVGLAVKVVLFIEVVG